MIDLTERCRFRDVPLGWYVDRLAAREPFAIARWSDGEWPCVLGRTGCNTDRHPYSPELRRDLTTCLLDKPTYIMALQEFMTRQHPLVEQVHDWMVEHDLAFDWVTADTFYRASLAGTLAPFTDALSERGVILVGPDRLGALDLFPIEAHIKTPLVNCHADVERVIAETAAAIEGLSDYCDPVVSISASMSANVIVHRLHKTHPDATLIDIGSLWEPYVGVSCRKYHAKVLERLQRG